MIMNWLQRFQLYFVLSVLVGKVLLTVSSTLARAMAGSANEK
jgi:hypothetical protein